MKVLLSILLSSIICSAQTPYISLGVKAGPCFAKGYKSDFGGGASLGLGIGVKRFSIGVETGLSSLGYYKEYPLTNNTGNNSLSTMQEYSSQAFHDIGVKASVNFYKGLSIFVSPSYNRMLSSKRDVSIGRDVSYNKGVIQDNISLEAGLFYSVGNKNKVNIGASYSRQLNSKVTPAISMIAFNFSYRFNFKK